MKMSQFDKDATKKHLENSHLWETEACCMKLYDETDDRYLDFGIIWQSDPLTIFIRDRKTLAITTIFHTFSSVEEMISAGWGVD
jgi:hypothetical protein